MPDPQTFKAEAVDWTDIGDQLFWGALRAIGKSSAKGDVRKVIVEALGEGKALAWDLLVDTALKFGEGYHKLEELGLPFIAAFTAPIVQGLFGATVTEEQFKRTLASGQGAAPAQAIVKGLMDAVTGGVESGELEPSQAGARRIASAAVQAALESSFNSLIPELLSHLIPQIGHFETIHELPETIIRALSVSRLVRRALSPIIDATCATPAKWDVEKRYRTQLLGASTVARIIARHPEQKEKWLEDLRRTGYSEQRIEALLAEQRHFFGPGDVRTFTTRGHWTHDKGLQHLKDQGFDTDAAEDALRLAGIQRIDELETAEASSIIAAYVQRDIDAGAFRSALGTAVSVAPERALLTELADVRRAMNIKHMSAPQVLACWKAGILAAIDYRRALEREGYPEDDVTALELLARKELDTEKTIEQHRRELEAQRAAEQQARAAAIAQRKADVDAARALARRGTEADLERAVVRGVVSIARLEEVYRQHYDDDTVQLLVDLVEQDRQAYLVQQAARDQAAQRGRARGIDVGALEQAVLEHVLTLDDFRSRLTALGFAAGDAQILTATLAARQATLTAAQQKRDAAAAAATKRSVNLATVETLVRRGHRTMAQYADLLRSLGFDDAAIADLEELLQLQIDDDAAARALRDQVATTSPARGLSLDQARRAVLLELQTVDWFARYLFDQGYTTDAQLVLLAELRHDVDEATAARARRQSGGGQVDAARLPLATAARAARLGVISPAAYQDRLVAAGYTQDDVDVEMDLLVLEIADVQARRAVRDQAPAPATPRELSLADVERAVKTNQASLEDYRARAIGLGYSLVDAQLLVDVLEQELATLTAARKQHDAIAFALASQGISLADLEARVKAGELPIAGYVAQLEAFGFAADETELLANLLLFELAGAPPAK